MNNNDTNYSPVYRAKRRHYVRLFMLAILFLVLGWFLFAAHSSSPLPGEESVEAAAQPLPDDSDRLERIRRFAVAQRQGRCQAMKYHLNEMAEARNEVEVEARRRSLGMLAGEMMNGYPRVVVAASSSNALPYVNTTDGRRDLNEARKDFRVTLQSVKGLSGKEAAATVTNGCVACHSRFRLTVENKFQ